MKSLEQKRAEAKVRLENSTYENSKAKRLGTKTQEEWQKAKEKMLANH